MQDKINSFNAAFVDLAAAYVKHIGNKMDVLRQRSRDLYMGVPLATGAIKTMRTNVVGRGLKLKPTIDREVLGIDADEAHALERRIEKEWELWADTPDCDAARIDNFYELQQLAFVSWLTSGDCLALLPVKKRRWQPYDLRVRLIEADRLSSPGGYDTLDDRIIGGVETDSTGEVIAYHFSKHHPLSLASQPMEWVRVPAYSENSGRRKLFYTLFKSITVDNGCEFQDFEGIEVAHRRKGKRTIVFFCHPYSAYERGSNENMNRLIRRFFPKGTNFDEVTKEQVAEAERWINNYPRKLLGWKSAAALFDEEARAA